MVRVIPGGDGSRTQAVGYVKGTADIVCVVPQFARPIFIEVKGPRGKLSVEQMNERQIAFQAGAEYIVAYSPELLEAALAELGVPLRARLKRAA